MLRMLLTLIVVTLPTLTAAQTSCSEQHQAQNCAEGYVWDSPSQTCVQQITG